MSKLAPIVEHCHQTLQWIIPTIDKFPRQRRFTVGERIETGLLDILTFATEASYATQKSALLQQASLRLNVVIHLWRLSYELKIIDKRRYFFGAEKLNIIGRQLGGWRKQYSNKGNSLKS